MKKIVCILNQVNDNFVIDMYFLNFKKPSVLASFINQYLHPKKLVEYNIVSDAHFNFKVIENNTLVESSKFANTLKEAIESASFLDASIDLVVDFDGCFEGSIVLPKLSGKALTMAYNDALQSKYKGLSKQFTITSKRKINQNKGYTYDLVFASSNMLSYIIGLFNKKLKIDNIVYGPSVLASLFSSSNGLNMGVLIEEHHTKVFLVNSGKIVCFKKIDGGWQELNQVVSDKFNLSLNDAKEYRHNNSTSSDVSQLTYSTFKKTVDEIYASFALYSELKQTSKDTFLDINKIIINSTDGYTEDIDLAQSIKFKKIIQAYSKNYEVQKNFMIDLYMSNHKGMVNLPNKVKYEKK